MYVVKKLNHHNAIFAHVEGHGKLMEFFTIPNFVSWSGRSAVLNFPYDVHSGFHVS